MGASISASAEPALAGGPAGAARVRALADAAMTAMADTAATRQGPVPGGGPAAVAAALAAALGEPGLLPERGVGERRALDELTRVLTAGSVDPGHPWCAAHLHGPILAVAAAADLVGSVLNPSMDSWDQAPIASELERELTATLARLCFPDAVTPDAVLTSGGTESNLVGLLLAREHGHTRIVCGANAHHSVARAAWLLGLPAPRVVPAERGRLRADALDLSGGEVVVATAGTTDAGTIDPLPEIARAARRAGAWLHVDASYGGAALFSRRLAGRLAGLAQADSVALDLHKFGWQPIAAGVLATRETITALHVRADYLNAGDDTEAGLPDLLGRSIRTSRRPDCVKIAVTLRALGRAGIAGLVERCCDLAREVAREAGRHPDLELWGEPALSTVLVRPRHGDAAGHAAAIRRRLLEDGTAVVGRATVDGAVWLKLTLLNPRATVDDYRGLLDLVGNLADETARRAMP
jgi:L-2,4-diaminobutyrate decarboxylase